MMRLGHESFAMTIATNAVALGLYFPIIPMLVLFGMGGLIVHSSDWPDLDHKPASINNDLGWFTRAIGHIIRMVSWKVWELTKNKYDRLPPHGDCHRGFTHTIEGCLVFAGVTSAVTYFIPLAGNYWWCWGIAVFIGCFSHVLIDWPSPAGVPFCLIYNMLRKGPNWKRHRLGNMETFRVGTKGENKVVVLLWFISIVAFLAYTGLLQWIVRILVFGNQSWIVTAIVSTVVLAIIAFAAYRARLAYQRLRK